MNEKTNVTKTGVVEAETGIKVGTGKAIQLNNDAEPIKNNCK
jgi:hypothetical protein